MFFFILFRAVWADSLMLSPAELEAIGIKNDAPFSSEENSKKETSKLRLDGIIYQNEENWCIWLNGQRFSFGQHPVQYKISKVTPDTVELIPTHSSEAPLPPLILRISQS